jgi:hypothetical protein
MPFFNYKIITTNSLAEGQIEAEDQQAAEDALVEQYVPEDHQFVDANHQPVEHSLVKLEVQEVKE